MASSAADALPATSVDIEGMASALGTPEAAADESTRGSAYTPATLAAGRLVHVHSAGGYFLCSYSATWTAATPNQGTRGAFTAFTPVAKPSFWWASPGGGRAIPANDRSGDASVIYAGQPSFSLVAAASKGAMLYMLGNLLGSPVLVAYRTDRGVAQFVTSFWLTSSVVTWNKGLLIQGTDAYVVGSGADGKLYLRKSTLDGTGVQYLGAKGWVNDEAAMTPLATTTGLAFSTSGVASLALHDGIWFIAVTTIENGAVTARFGRTRHPLRAWEAMPDTVALGADPLATLHFQTALHPNNDHPAIAAADAATALPYAYSTADATSLRTRWGLLPVPRRRV